MKIKLCTLIFPRLEVFFLEEWIEHNLQLGVDEIYVYENGTISHDESDFVLEGERRGKTWVKKPNADYFLDYTDEQIYDKLHEVVEKYPNVYLKEWHCMYKTTGRVGQGEFDAKDGQLSAFRDCVWRNSSGRGLDWWLFCDPDEYFVLKHHRDFKEFIVTYEDVSCFYFQQRVFAKRMRDVNVKEICNWGYDMSLSKPLIVDSIDKYDVHMPVPSFGKSMLVPLEVGLHHHYRGHPSEQGGDAHRAPSYLKSEFDKIDTTMMRFLGR